MSSANMSIETQYCPFFRLHMLMLYTFSTQLDGINRLMPYAVRMGSKDFDGAEDTDRTIIYDKDAVSGLVGPLLLFMLSFTNIVGR